MPGVCQEINYVQIVPMVHTVMKVWLKCWLRAPKMSRTSCIMKRISKEATLTGVTEQGRLPDQRAYCVYIQAFKRSTISSCEIGYFMCGWPCVILISKSWDSIGAAGHSTSSHICQTLAVQVCGNCERCITTAPDLVQSCVKQKEKRSELHLPAVKRVPQCVFNFKGVLTEHFRVVIFFVLLIT